MGSIASHIESFVYTPPSTSLRATFPKEYDDNAVLMGSVSYLFLEQPCKNPKVVIRFIYLHGAQEDIRICADNIIGFAENLPTSLSFPYHDKTKVVGCIIDYPGYGKASNRRDLYRHLSFQMILLQYGIG